MAASGEWVSECLGREREWRGMADADGLAEQSFQLVVMLVLLLVLMLLCTAKSAVSMLLMTYFLLLAALLCFVVSCRIVSLSTLCCSVWDSRTLTGLISDRAEACLQEILLPDYPVYAASSSPHTAADELMIGGELIWTSWRHSR